MCYEAEDFIADNGRKPVTEFILGLDVDARNWVLAGIQLLEQRKGIIRNQNIETKHIRGKIFELKFKKLAIRILFAYHPSKRKFILLLHGITKKRNDLKASDIETAEDRYKITLNRQHS